MASPQTKTPPSEIRQAAAFIALTFALSWLYWLAVAASARGWIPVKVPLTPFGSIAPALAALVLSRWWGGGPAVRDLLRSMVRWRAGLALWLVALFGPPLIALASLLAARTFGALPTRSSIPGYLALLAPLEILVLGGPLGEEPGWRGFLLPRLLSRYGPVAAAQAAGAVWFAWHLPLFWLPGSAQAGIPLSYYAVTILSYSTVLTWIYVRSNGSVLLCILFHTSFDASLWLAGAVYRGVLLQPACGTTWVGLNVAAALAAGVSLVTPGRDKIER
ncbi:MAG TPA: CPBP family intramembrane glutamic endopeptidase [Thermoanaerobaculia bacterium]|jgi:membrane protease YdiL (CAAX protease family)|nr:CPBP family intramembrane glutamic endopeptidase [Thermoanaerobaculia bacterium]